MRACNLIGLIILGITFTSMSVNASESSRPKAKMATKIPASIQIPDSLDTRLGTLKFKDGFPDKSTVEKVYDNLDFMHGVRAYLTGLRGTSLVGFKRGLKGLGPVNQTVVLWENLMDSKSLLLTPNTQSIYAMLWIDTKKTGPIVMETPPKILGIIDDAWFQHVTDFGMTGPDKGKGGKFLILPPNYKGKIPKGYYVARSKTFGNWVIFRGFQVKGSTKPAVRAAKKYFRVYPLAKAKNRPKMKWINGSGLDFNTIGGSDYSSFEDLNELVQYEPNSAMDPEILGLFKSIGIEKGKPFKPDARMKKILTDAANVAHATVRTLAFRGRDKAGYIYPNSAWSMVFKGGSSKFITKTGIRLLDARSFFFFYATGITPAMSMIKVGKGSQYGAAFVDSKGRALDGGKNYKLHFPPNIPAKKFWSIILYDNQTRSLLQTDVRFPSLDNLKKGVKYNSDKSVDIYFGPKAPKGKKSNWIQTMPGKGWNTILRLYGPLKSWFDKTWRPSEIEEID